MDRKRQRKVTRTHERNMIQSFPNVQDIVTCTWWKQEGDDRGGKGKKKEGFFLNATHKMYEWCLCATRSSMLEHMCTQRLRKEARERAGSKNKVPLLARVKHQI